MSAVVEAGALDRAAWAPTVLPAVARVHRDLLKGFGTWPDAAAIPVASDVLAQARLALDRAVRSFQVEFADRGLDDGARTGTRDELMVRLQRFAVRAQAALRSGRPTPAVAAARVAESILLHDLEEQAVSVTEHARRWRATDWAEPLALSYRGLALIADVSRRSSWGEATRRAPRVEGDVLAWRETPVGPVVIGGPKANRYRGQFAAIIDLGGNDEYADIPVGGPALLVDLAGDDLYRLAAPSGAVGGVQLWFDKSGDDRYETTTFGLGGAFHGVQILLDQSGNDAYAARSLSLGAAIFGVGILIDGAGNDRYRAVRGAMGFGGPHGFGALIDHAGDDVYEAVSVAKTSIKLLHPRASMMQGCGMGIRQLSFGGLGMLIDSAGDDRYEAKEYAQGVGYVGGLGVLLDRKGNDRYRGEKFVQASGVHAGVGVLRDVTGDDEYVLTRLQGQAMAWDLGIALLEDGGGRDSFRAPERAQAFAANNGIAVMRLGGANPRLLCEQEATCRGHAGSNDYAGGRGAKSIAIVTLASP